MNCFFFQFLCRIEKVGLKKLLQQALSELKFYGNLVCEFKKYVSRADFSDQFGKIIMPSNYIGYAT